AKKLPERKKLTDYSLALIRVLLKQGDHRAASLAVSALQRDMPAEGNLAAALSDRDAAGFLVQCMTAAEKDASLSDEKRTATREEYAGQAMTLLRRAAEQNVKSVKDLKMAAEFQPLHNREDFQKLLAEIEAKNGK